MIPDIITPVVDTPEKANLQLNCAVAMIAACLINQSDDTCANVLAILCDDIIACIKANRPANNN